MASLTTRRLLVKGSHPLVHLGEGVGCEAVGGEGGVPGVARALEHPRVQGGHLGQPVVQRLGAQV